MFICRIGEIFITKKLRLFGIILLCGVTFSFLAVKGVIVFDHSAIRRGEGVYWKAVLYMPCSGEYTEGKTIAKTGDGWKINEVEEDDTHTFIVLRSFLDQYLLVREDYEIPVSGNITTAFWGDEAIYDREFCELVEDILRYAKSDFQYETEGLFQRTDEQEMETLYVGYEGCPIGTEYMGYMGKIHGTWYITTRIDSEQRGEDGAPKPYQVWCYTIPEKYIELLEVFFR